MKLVKIIFVFLITIIAAQEHVKAQYCGDFYNHKNCRVYSSFDYQPYGQRKGALLEINKTYEYKLVLYGKKDYKFAICTDSGYGPVHYIILSANTKQVLYDNITDNYIESVGFTNENTQNIIIKLNVLSDLEEKDEIKDAFEKRVCVGINIMWRKIPQIGF